MLTGVKAGTPAYPEIIAIAKAYTTGDPPIAEPAMRISRRMKRYAGRIP
jgi:hypothetical protein